jgi:acetyl esterase/lipase
MERNDDFVGSFCVVLARLLGCPQCFHFDTLGELLIHQLKMRKSFTYYLTLLVIKIKGIKRIFSQDPIDYLVLRKDDVLEPTGNLRKSGKVSNFRLGQSRITEIKGDKPSKNLLLFIHGGAFISGPARHHWDFIEKISKSTDYTIWLCDYPKAPEHTIHLINENIDLVYKASLENFKPSNVVLMGDSVGGTLALTLIQRLILSNQPLPSKVILVSPVLDASFENPEIDKVDKADPMLSKKGVLSAKKMCSGGLDLKSKELSPLFGNFHNFPPTYLFLAENDITYPDQRIFCKKLGDQGIEHMITVGKGMPHIWPLLPVMEESRIALKQIVRILGRMEEIG